MKKFMAVALSALLSVSLLAGCGGGSGASESAPASAVSSPSEAAPSGEPASSEQETAGEKTAIRVASMKGPTSIGLLKLMEDAEKGEAANDYSFAIVGTADEIVPKLVKGELDLAAIPANLASVLYGKTQGEISVLAVNTLGVLYLVETGDTIHSIADLKGKTIYSTGKGTTPEYALNYVLSANGIDPEKDLTVEYKSESTEVAALLSQGENAIAMLPQPYVATVQAKNDKLRIALNMTEEWDKVQGEDKSALITGVVVARNDFISENPEALDTFLNEYQKSVAFANDNLDESAALTEKYGIVPAAAIARQAIPYCNITFIEGTEMKEKLSGYLKALFDQNPQAVGGTLPDDAFYFSR
ncbi:ABC transporter substrate-binding protein [Marasmitruncus massiliensis]|uniref:ABC transporter substrate-binding protein n=1 Tax=Marasmitruncus massiliensis TaxID=1944642 RepID=UPI000C797208|nr:MqnA/MqnD/SBP family protein [Marasmitruncus massiliensis]